MHGVLVSCMKGRNRVAMRFVDEPHDRSSSDYVSPRKVSFSAVASVPSLFNIVRLFLLALMLCFVCGIDNLVRLSMIPSEEVVESRPALHDDVRPRCWDL